MANAAEWPFLRECCDEVARAALSLECCDVLNYSGLLIVCFFYEEAVVLNYWLS